MSTVIAFGIQPYQVEAGMGGTILKLSESEYQVTIIDLTTGEFSKIKHSDYRKKEAIKASRILGIDERITLDYLHPELSNTQEIREEISEIYQNTSVDILFIPYPIDTQPETKIVSDICKSSLNYFQKKYSVSVKTKIFYYFASPFHYFQKPALIMDTSKEIEMKVEALKCYESQFGKNIQNNPLFEDILSLDRYYGILIDKKFGESFISEEPLAIQNFDYL